MLDEPSSNLDSDSIADLRATIAYLKSLGKTVILSEHRLYYLRGIADLYIYLKDGEISGDYTAGQFEKIPESERREMGLRTNDLSSLTVNAALVISSASAGLKDFRFACKNSPETLKIDSSSCFCGLKKYRGTVTVDGTSCRARERLNKCYMVMQDAGASAFHRERSR